MRTSFPRKNKHGRKGAKKPLEKPTDDARVAAAYDKGFKAGKKEGFVSGSDCELAFMESLLTVRKATDIHHKVRERIRETKGG